MKLNAFLDRTASSDPVPGGGSISALAAASAASLVEMVANLTADRKGFETTQTEMKKITGNTYPVKHILKMAGAKWNAEKKQWEIEEENIVKLHIADPFFYGRKYGNANISVN